MSDETIQYITTDYLIEVDGGEPAPAPIEYIVELGQVGVQGVPGEKGEPGFSPTVGYILNDNTFKINITNQDGVTQTPNLYDYFADKNGYLKVDGSNAQQNITINQAEFISLRNNSGVRIRNNNGRGTLQLSPNATYLQTGSYGLVANYDSGLVSLGNVNGTAKVIQATDDKVYYEAYSSNPSDPTKEIATIGDIPTVSDATITLTQGGVTKGTFTLNGSATTIDLDAGGGTITNPLTLTSTDGTRSLTLGINNSNNKIQSTYNFISGGSTFSSSIYLLAGKTDPITLTDDNYGKYTIGLKYDDDTIKVNQDGELYAVGGGTTYTAGTGIDITGGVISIDTSVVAQLSDIPTNSDYVDLTTDQTVGGTKTFSNDQKFGGYIYLDGSSNAQGVVHRVGNTRKHLVLRNNQASTVYVGNTYDALNLRGSGTRPSYYANGTSKDIAFTNDIPSLTNYVTNTDYATTSVGGVVKVDNSTITVNNGVISATPARNIGEIVQSTIPLTDAGLHLLDGSLISGSGSYADFVTYIAGLVSTYPDLFETEANWQQSVTTYGVCGKFVYDSTNNTVRLPKITGIIEGTIDATALGDLVKAGLPNITGTFGANFTQGNFFNRGSGAFGSYRDNNINTTVPNDSIVQYSNNNMWDFDASRSSSIYGNSTTVQPQTIKAFIYIVIATSTKTDIQVDIDEIATDLNGKADKDLSNITTVNTPITTTAINPFVNKLTDADITTAPSADINSAILYKDTNNNSLGGLVCQRFSDGTQAIAISATNKISGTKKSAYFNVYVDSSGNDHCDASAGVKSTITNWAMPSGTSYPVAFNASGYFTASQNGYLEVSVKVNSPSGFYLNNTSSGLNVLYTAPYAGWDVNGYIPIAAGQTVSLYIVDGYVNAGFPKFIPCIGG